MTSQSGKEIVVEFERIQLIRKRARTESRFCASCGAASDAVSHADAAELFEVSPARLLRFVIENYCHYDIAHNGRTYLCVSSLLERIKTSSIAAGTKTKLLGDNNEEHIF